MLLQNLGCRPSYTPECPDFSDFFVCQANICKRDIRFFTCQDKKYCIMKYLVCDGYAQCEDESGNLLFSILKLYFLKCNIFR